MEPRVPMTVDAALPVVARALDRHGIVYDADHLRQFVAGKVGAHPAGKTLLASSVREWWKEFASRRSDVPQDGRHVSHGEKRRS